MTLAPKITEDARRDLVTLVEKLVARSQRGFPITSKRTLDDIEAIAADDLHSNYPGVRGAYLATLRLHVDVDTYEKLLDGPLSAVADSKVLEELAQDVADQASDPTSIDSEDVRRRLVEIAEDDLRGGLKAVRGAFLTRLEANLPHSGDTYDVLLAGPLSFLADL
jgi:hypothetical protein